MEISEERKKTPRLLTAQCIVDVIIWIIIGLPVLFLFLQGTPIDRGFFCDDQSLMYPYQEEIVTTTILLAGCLGLSFLATALVEILNWFERRRKPFCHCTKDFPDWVKAYAVFLFGFVFDQLFTESIKNQVGRLRPHFFSLCKPIYDTTNCSSRYITEYRCMTEEHEARELRSSRQAFPSGHATLSMFVAVYFCMYIQQRLDVTYSLTLKTVLQFGLVLLSLLCGISRIQDNYHHASDVICGFLLGAGLAYFVYLSVAKRVLGRRGQLRLNIEQSSCQSDLFHGNGVSPRSATTLLLLQNELSNGVSTTSVTQSDKDLEQNGNDTNSTRPLSAT